MAEHDPRTLGLLRRARHVLPEGHPRAGYPTPDANQAFELLLRDLRRDLRRAYPDSVHPRIFIKGGDHSDLLQEARIGIWKAVSDFNETNPDGMNWRNFAITLCSRRHVITAMMTAQRKKFAPLNDSVSLDMPVVTGDADDGEQTFADFLADTDPSPLDRIIQREDDSERLARLRATLTPMERKILDHYDPEDSYKENGDRAGVKSKAVDNGLLRIRRKATCLNNEFSQERELELARWS